MVALAQAVTEWVTTFDMLRYGDMFSFRPDLDVWLVASGRPSVIDVKRCRLSLNTFHHGVVFANEWSRVCVRIRR